MNCLCFVKNSWHDWKMWPEEMQIPHTAKVNIQIESLLAFHRRMGKKKQKLEKWKKDCTTCGAGTGKAPNHTYHWQVLCLWKKWGLLLDEAAFGIQEMHREEKKFKDSVTLSTSHANQVLSLLGSHWKHLPRLFAAKQFSSLWWLDG